MNNTGEDFNPLPYLPPGCELAADQCDHIAIEDICPGVCAADMHTCSDGTMLQRDPANNCTFPDCSTGEIAIL